MKTVGLRQSKGIVEHFNRSPEAHIMLDRVLGILRFVPIEVHREGESIVTSGTYTCQYTPNVNVIRHPTAIDLAGDDG